VSERVWDGIDRRKGTGVCPVHELHMSAIEQRLAGVEGQQAKLFEKLDQVSERQIEYIKTQARLEYAISNGMRTDIMVIRERLDTFCAGVGSELKEIRGRIDALDSFAWFRNLANKLKDNAIEFLIKAVIAGALISFVAYFWARVIDALAEFVM
jgi:hypothetical protein